MQRLDSYLSAVRESNSSFMTLSGGLGNQLFQYCFARQLQQEINAPVYFDVSLISLSNKSENSLPSIQTLLRSQFPRIDSNSKLTSFLAYHSISYSQRKKKAFLAFIPKVCTEFKLTFLQQASKIFDSSLRFQERGFYIGSFTTHEYWSSSFQIRIQEVNELLNEYMDAIPNTNRLNSDVVIHARRGDYASNLKTRRIHGIYGVNYYLDVLSNLQNVQKREIVILSDERQFALQLKEEIEKTFGMNNVRLASSRDPIYILAVYRNASTFIGCNSTFSWWLAYLGSEKTRYLPFNWFDEGRFGFDPDRYFPLSTKLIRFAFEE